MTAGKAQAQRQQFQQQVHEITPKLIREMTISI